MFSPSSSDLEAVLTLNCLCPSSPEPGHQCKPASPNIVFRCPGGSAYKLSCLTVFLCECVDKWKWILKAQNYNKMKIFLGLWFGSLILIPFFHGKWNLVWFSFLKWKPNKCQTSTSRPLCPFHSIKLHSEKERWSILASGGITELPGAALKSVCVLTVSKGENRKDSRLGQ